MRRDTSTIHQRDETLAIESGLLVGFVAFALCWALVALVVCLFYLREFQGLFNAYFALLHYYTNFDFILKNVPYDSSVIVDYFDHHRAVIYANYAALVVSGGLGLWVGWSEYNAMMINERHIMGPQFWQYPGEAADKLKAAMIDEIKASGGGVYIGGVQISLDRETKHFLAAGKTGGGKTVAISPIIKQAIKRGDKVGIYCNKGDFTSTISDINGDMPILIAPWDKRTAYWDVAKDCTTVSDAAELAGRLIKDEGDMWSAGAQQILTGFIRKLQHEKQDLWTWRDLADLLVIPMSDVVKMIKIYHPEGLRAVESTKMADGSEGASKTTESLMITMSAQLSPVYRLAEAFEGATEKFSVADFLADKTRSRVVILQGNATYPGIQQTVVRGILSMLGRRINTGAYKERKPSAPGLWLFFDEFPQLGKMTEIKPFLEIGRSKGVRVLLGVQDVAQLRELYTTDGADAIKEIFQNYIFCSLGAGASESASNAVGTRIVERYTHQRDAGAYRSSESWNRDNKELICPSSVFSFGLGRYKDIGVNSIFWPTGKDVYKLLFRFSEAAKEVRPPAIPADWTVAPWARARAEEEARIEVSEQEISSRLAIIREHIEQSIIDTKSSVELKKPAEKPEPGEDIPAPPEFDDEPPEIDDSDIFGG